MKLDNPHGIKSLGSRERLAKAREAAKAAHSAMADDRAEVMRKVMDELSAKSANAAAKELNRRSISAARGGAWSTKGIIRLHERLRLAATLSGWGLPIASRQRG
jgi:hypothetical protein